MTKEEWLEQEWWKDSNFKERIGVEVEKGVYMALKGLLEAAEENGITWGEGGWHFVRLLAAEVWIKIMDKLDG